jgi:hypothetical protein
MSPHTPPPPLQLKNELEQPPVVPSIHSERWILGAVSLLILLSLVSCISSQGADIYIRMNVPGANIRLDGRVLSSDNTPTEFREIPHGERQLEITHRDYQPPRDIVHHGWFSNHNLTYQLKPIPITLVVNTTSGAEILLNNSSVGHADQAGHFQKDNLEGGSYQIRLREAGYLESSYAIEIHPSQNNVVNAYLTMSPGRQRQIEENRQEISSLLRTAQQQFANRQYSSALASIDAALKLDPSNGEAAGFRARIVETMNILK